jgi:hypothetical protein
LQVVVNLGIFRLRNSIRKANRITTLKMTILLNADG